MSQYGVNLEKDNRGWIPLHFAASVGQSKALRFLTEILLYPRKDFHAGPVCLG
jgi:ankyrin repeat protein